MAALRSAVVRDWHYLHGGDPGHQRRYLSTYRESPKATLIGAFDGTRLVGAATGTPMEDHADWFGAALATIGLPLARIFYCAESVLLPQYRGQGIGHRFLGGRGACARVLGRDHVVFCSVNRPADHPARPADARSNEAFWRKRGHAPLPDVIAGFHWRDPGEEEETRKPLQFWLRRL